MYQSTYVKFEKRGGRLVPVRVTYDWVTFVNRSGSSTRRFIPVRVTEVKWRDIRGDREQAPEAWVSSTRMESRARLLTLKVKWAEAEGGEPILVDPTDRPYLEMGDEPLTQRQAEQPMDAEPDSREWYMRRQWAESRGYDDEEAAA